jgi:hypothetical protein
MAPQPARLRPLVAASWRRSATVDPDRLPEMELPADEVRDTLSAAPIAAAMPVVRRLLVDDARDAGLVVAIGDPDGRLLWVDGDRTARRSAEAMGFVPGAGWAEDRVGTSAPGTALRLGSAVQIRGPEHYANVVKRWSCTAVPIRDPLDDSLIGVLDVTGDDDAAARRTLSLVSATAAAMEGELAVRALRSGRVPAVRRQGVPAGARLRLLGSDVGTLDDPTVGEVQLGARHSEILATLSANPAGMSAESLAEAVYGDARAVVTLRAEIVRLRRMLAAHGSVVSVTTRPYRLVGVTSDADDVLAMLDRGARLQALQTYAGPVLPGSVAPGVDELRERVRIRLRESMSEDGSVDALLAWTASPDGADDEASLRALLQLLPARSPKRARVVAALDGLGRTTSDDILHAAPCSTTRMIVNGSDP